MHLWIFNQQLTSLSFFFWIICLAIYSTSLLGVCWICGFFSHSLIICSARLVYAHWGYFWVLQGASSNTLEFGKISRSLIRTWGFPFDFLFPAFLEEAPIFLVNLMTSSAKSGRFVLSVLLSYLLSCCRVSLNLTAFLWRSFCGIFLML